MTILNQFSHDLEAAAVKLREVSSREEFMKTLLSIRNNTSLLADIVNIDFSVPGPNKDASLSSGPNTNPTLSPPFASREKIDKTIQVNEWPWE